MSDDLYQRSWCPLPASIDGHLVACVLADGHDGLCSPWMHWRHNHDCVRNGCHQLGNAHWHRGAQ